MRCLISDCYVRTRPEPNAASQARQLLQIPASEKLVGPLPPWRGSLLPLGGEAAPNPPPQFPQTHRSARFYDGYAAERDDAAFRQAPSPPVRAPTPRLQPPKSPLIVRPVA